MVITVPRHRHVAEACEGKDLTKADMDRTMEAGERIWR
jgi:hypothetical protein